MTAEPVAGTVFVGADMLEVVGIAMYADPLVVYRELIQNSADGIDRAIREGILQPDDGRITITFDAATRTVVLRDNGVGLPNDEFVDRMLAIGASPKRFGSYRGFRGIGRLAGLGHCRNLVFRSLGKGDRYIFEARWDSSKVRDLLAKDDMMPLSEVAAESVQITRTRESDEAAHFEVRLEGVRRLPDDRLFHAERIGQYLAQVAPARFSPHFRWGGEILAELQRRTPILQVGLMVASRDIYKPYEDAIEVRKGRLAHVRDVEYIEVPTDGGLAAFGWIAHTEYLGAFSRRFAGRGLRVRSGNIQIGDETLLEHAFPEERFNFWSVGEFHIFDSRLRPNARRDAFEPSIAADDLLNQLVPYGNSIAKRCRTESKGRNLVSRTEATTTALLDLRRALSRSKSALCKRLNAYLGEQIEAQIESLRNLASAQPDHALALKRAASRLRRNLSGQRKVRAPLTQRDAGRLDVLKWLQRHGYSEIVKPIANDITKR